MNSGAETNPYKAIVAMTQLFAERHDGLAELLQRVIDQVSRFSDATCLLALLSDDGAYLDVVATHATDAAAREHLVQVLPQGRIGIDRFDPTSLTLRALREGVAVSEWISDGSPLSAQRARSAASTGARAICAVPLRRNGTGMGSLTLFRKQPAFEREELVQLQSLADHAVLAIENARLVERAQQELEERATTQATLERTSAELRRAHDRVRIVMNAGRAFAIETAHFSRLLQAIVEHTAVHMRAYAGISLLSPDGARLEFCAQHAAGELGAQYVACRHALLGSGVSAIDDLPTTRALHGDSVFYEPELRAPEVWRRLTPEIRELVARFDVRSFAAVSLRNQGKPIGLLFVHRFGPREPDGGIDSLDLELLRLIADQAALALANGTLLDRITCELAEHKKTRDALQKSEESFRQAQRMEAVGRLAGGIAHDFNNILTVILGYAGLILDELHEGDPLRSEVEELRRNGVRAADLTRQLLAFSRKQILSPRVLCLNDVLQGIDKMLRRLLGEDVELRFLLTDELHLCHVDASQMEQVLLNLAVNARDAMPEGGSLTIETANVVLDDHYVAEHPDAVVGPHVMLSVSDTGIGMDSATMARIFEPFFTTKPKDRGTGLGLATVYGIIKQSGGCVWVYSEVGIGTTFRIYLPEAPRDATSARASLAVPTRLHGDETILLVEDDGSVRKLIASILNRQGYRVLQAANGGEALRLAEQHAGPIHLLLTDVIMPKMSGKQLVERLGGQRPEMKVLYMSGYTENAIVHHGLLDVDIAFIQKPITAQTLLSRVREILDRKA